MSDFDKIMRDKMNEEESFPRMEQNWQKLANRMTVASPPAHPPQLYSKLYALKWAVAATGLLLVASNIWWWYHHNITKHTAIDTVSQAQKQPNNAVETRIIHQTDTVAVYKNVSITPNEVQSGVNTPYSRDAYGAVKQPISKENTVENAVSNNNIVESTPSVKTPISDNKTPISETKTSKNAPIADMKSDDKTADKSPIQDNKTVKNDAPIVSNTPLNKNEPAVAVEKNNQVPLKTEENIDKKTTNTNQAETIAKTTETPKKEGKFVETIETPKQIDNAVAAVEKPKVAAIDSIKTAKEDKKEENAVANTSLPTNSEQVNKNEDLEMKPIITPYKWKPTFSIGANGVAALPIGKDFSLFRGGGATLGIAISDKLRVDIVGTTGKLAYNLKEHKPRWGIPKDPRGPGRLPNPNDVDLHRIDGHQKRQQVSINLSYLLNNKGWVTPKIEVGYAWQHISSQTAKFEFRDRVTGNELYLIEISDPQILKNLWHVGVGAEKSFGNFTADISASFQKDLSNTSVDFMVFRGGLRYNF